MSFVFDWATLRDILWFDSITSPGTHASARLFFFLPMLSSSWFYTRYLVLSCMNLGSLTAFWRVLSLFWQVVLISVDPTRIEQDCLTFYFAWCVENQICDSGQRNRNKFHLEPPVATPIWTPEEFSTGQHTANTLS